MHLFITKMIKFHSLFNQVIKQELGTRQQILENLNTRVSHSLNQRRNASVARVVDGVRCLNVENTELVALLSEKEELLEHALNRWADFQKLYTELKNINDWFAEKEEALNRFQRIVAQREFEIALEDVKVSVLTQTFSRKHYSSHFKVFQKKRKKNFRWETLQSWYKRDVIIHPKVPKILQVYHVFMATFSLMTKLSVLLDSYYIILSLC